MNILSQSLFRKLMWGIVIAVVLAIAWIALRANYEYRQLEAGSCRINALIEKSNDDITTNRCKK